MKRLLPTFLLIATSLCAAAPASADGLVVVCALEGMVDDGMRVFVERVILESQEADAIIFEVNTPGGRVDSAIEISNAIIATPVHTIAYIRGMGAISAGALISYSCRDIIMASEANIGASAPVIPTAEGMMPTGEKEVSYLRAKMRSLAERHGRNPALAEAMVDKDIELRLYTEPDGTIQIYGIYHSPDGGVQPVEEAPGAADMPPGGTDPGDLVRRLLDSSLKGSEAVLAQFSDHHPSLAQAEAEAARPQGELILPSGKLLTLTPQEALRYGLISSIANTLDQVLVQYDYEGAQIRRLKLSAGEKIFRWLTSPVVAGLLLMLGIGGLYLEIRTPGFGVPGLIGILCLSLFFGAHFVIGIANWFDIILVVVGLILLAIEIFVLPGFGVAGAAGILCLIAGLYMTLTTAPIPEFSWEYDRMQDAIMSLLIATLSLGLLMYLLWKVLPHTSLYSGLVLRDAQLAGGGYVVQRDEEEVVPIGAEGVAVSLLRPVGRGRFGNNTVQVVSRAEYIEPGTPIVVVQIDGNRYVVDRMEDHQ